jgi:hypothetical protein
MHSLKIVTTAVQRLPVFETFPSAVSNYIRSVAPFIYLEPQRVESGCYSTAVPCDDVVRQPMPVACDLIVKVPCRGTDSEFHSNSLLYRSCRQTVETSIASRSSVPRCSVQWNIEFQEFSALVCDCPSQTPVC